MAEKYIISTYASSTEQAKTLSGLLQTHAAAYFDSVSQDASFVYCKSNDSTILTISFNNPVSVKMVSGGSSTSKSLTAKTLYAMYVCTDGIALSFIKETNGAEQPFGLVITKDNNGRTVILAEENLIPEGNVWSCNPVSQGFQNTTIAPSIAKNAALCPFMIDYQNELSYTPDAGFFVYRKYTEPGDIFVGGVKYFSNGLWAVKNGRA